MNNLAKLLLAQLSEDHLKQLLSGCIITQSGVQGVVEDGMLKTSKGKMDIRPAQIVAIKLAEQPADLKEELATAKKEKSALKRENTRLQKKIDQYEAGTGLSKKKKK